MRLHHRWFLLSLASFFLIAHAVEGLALTEKERDRLRAFPEWLPYKGCERDKYFGQCFNWTSDECEGMVADSSYSCLNQHEPQFMKPASGTFDLWHEKLVRCVWGDIRAKMKKRQVESTLCRNKEFTR